MVVQEITKDTIDYNQYTIHIVDDSPLVVTTLINILEEKDYTVTSSTNGEDALRVILNEIPALVILDVEMPTMDGYETIKHLKSNPQTANIPVIFLTGLTKPEVIKNLFDLGGADYICKPFVKEEILARVEKEIKNIMLQKMLKEKMSKLAEVVSMDSLTKTSNKIHMTSIIKTKIQKLQTDKKGVFSLMYLDIDDFNSFVKINGVSSLNSTLKKIAMILKRSVRDKDILSHWHGDEFMVLFQQISKENLEKIAIAIRNNITKAPFDSNTHLTCSISIVDVSLDDKEIEQVLDKLKNRMQDAKKTKKSSIVSTDGRLLI